MTITIRVEKSDKRLKPSLPNERSGPSAYVQAEAARPIRSTQRAVEGRDRDAMYQFAGVQPRAMA